MTVETIDFFLALGVLAMQIVGIALIAVIFLRKVFPDLEDVAKLVGEWGLWIGFVLTLGASAMTLIYSDILGFTACILCWWQRIFLYSQVVILGIAAWKEHRHVWMYSIPLSAIGGAIAFYQHLLQMGIASAEPCNAIPGTDCAARFLFEFSYITLPLMAFTLFAFLIVLMLFVRSSQKRQ